MRPHKSVKPSISGMTTSLMMSVGLRRCAASKARRPLVAAVTLVAFVVQG